MIHFSVAPSLPCSQIFLRKTCLLSCPRATPRRPRCTDQSIRDSKKRRGAIFRVLLVRRVGARQPRNPVGTKLNQARNQASCYPKLKMPPPGTKWNQVGTKLNQARNQGSCYAKLIRKGCHPDSYYNTIIKVREHGTKLRSTARSHAPSLLPSRILRWGGTHTSTCKHVAR